VYPNPNPIEHDGHDRVRVNPGFGVYPNPNPPPPPPVNQISLSCFQAPSDFPTLLRVLCEASEYSELPVRHNEEHVNAALAAQLPWYAYIDVYIDV